MFQDKQEISALAKKKTVNGRVETGGHFVSPSRVSLWDLAPTKLTVPATKSACFIEG